VKRPNIDKLESECNKIYYTYEYQLLPTDAQRLLLSKHCGAMRFVYNYCLTQSEESYKTTGKRIPYLKLKASFAQLKKQEEFAWLKEINSQSIQKAVKNLDTAYLRFFKGIGGLPTFHKKHGKQSFHVPQFIKLIDGKLYFPKFKEGIKINLHRPCVGEICFANIRKTKTCKYFATITCLVDKNSLEKYEKTDKAVGLDMGIKDLIITSDGEKIKNLKQRRKFNKHLAYLHRQLSKKKKGSSRRERARLRLAFQYEKISNKKKDHIHKATTRLVRENQTIAVESLAVQNMMKNHSLAGAIGDCSWSEILRQLEYKCRWHNRTFVKIERFFPSSKMCHECGYINHGLSLNDRKWSCPHCGHAHDRDVNAARNILSQGLNILKSGSGTDSDYKQKPEEALPAHCHAKHDNHCKGKSVNQDAEQSSAAR